MVNPELACVFEIFRTPIIRTANADHQDPTHGCAMDGAPALTAQAMVIHRDPTHGCAMDGAPAPRRRVADVLGVLVLMLAILGGGCVPRAEMRLGSPAVSNSIAWWEMTDPSGLRPPLVGIEEHLTPESATQTIFCEQGLRIFRYEDRRFIRSSAPLPRYGGTIQPAVLRSSIRRFCRHSAIIAAPPMAARRMGHPAADAEPHSNPPDDRIAKIMSVTDLSGWLAEFWPQRQVPPPAGMTHSSLLDELGRFPHGVGELLRAADAL